MITSCPACDGDALEAFYRVEAVPVSSCILLDNREEAAAYQRGDLELTICQRCGFIFNRLFRPELVDYTMPYEESQAFSPRFLAFQQELIERLVDEYLLEGKEVFEIGCGKGAFLEALCRRAGARGVGIDPAFEPGRVGKDVDVIVHREFFDADHTHLTGDLICCRHTLEHIQPVAEFLRLVHRSAVQRSGAVVFFEIPDVERILREGAFWDVYFEHCSYFSVPSLDALFRSSGFEVLRLERGFDDQYLLIDARMGDVDRRVDTEAVAQLAKAARRFGEVAGEEVDRYRELIGTAHSRGEQVVLWGAGSKAAGFLAALGLDDAVAGVVDINPFKQGFFLPGSGHQVIRPAELVELNPDLVLVMNPIYFDEIRESLLEMGLAPDVVAVGEAGSHRP